FGWLLCGTAQADVRLCALRVVSQPFKNGCDHVLFTVLIAAHAYTQCDRGRDTFLDVPNQADDFFSPFDRHFDFDDCGKHLLAHDVFANGARGDVAHQRSDRISLLETHAGFGQRLRHGLQVAEPNADARTAEFNGETYVTQAHATAHVVGL